MYVKTILGSEPTNGQLSMQMLKTCRRYLKHTLYFNDYHSTFKPMIYSGGAAVLFFLLTLDV